MQKLKFQIGSELKTITIRELIIAGWTGRDSAAVEHHITELEAIGVARPRAVPCYYRVGANLLSTEEEIEVCGTNSSGEVEAVIISVDGELLVGVGSDHTDRRVESYGVTVSKQMCPKPVGRELWRLDEIKEHWDALILRSWATRGGRQTLYQEGPISRMHTPWTLIDRFTGAHNTLPTESAMFCGTLPVLGSIGASDLFEIELEDPVLRRHLKHRYSAKGLAYSD